MYVKEKMFNVFIFISPKSFLGKKKLCNACETKYLIFNIFIFIFLKIVF